MHKVLGVVTLLTLGWLILLWYALAYGATAFPFTRTTQPFEPDWEVLGEASPGQCETTGYLRITIVNVAHTVGWKIWYASRDEMLAVRYELKGLESGTPNWLVYAVIKGQEIAVQYGRAFNPQLDTHVCNIFDKVDT